MTDKTATQTEIRRLASRGTLTDASHGDAVYRHRRVPVLLLWPEFWCLRESGPGKPRDHGRTGAALRVDRRRRSAGQPVQIAVADNIDGCLLRTIFEGIDCGGQAAEMTVPVGETRVVQLCTPHPGRHKFHCGENMYSGTMVAR